MTSGGRASCLRSGVLYHSLCLAPACDCIMLHWPPPSCLRLPSPRRAGDIYVHADLHGASTTIVKNHAPATPIPPLTLAQAGGSLGHGARLQHLACPVCMPCPALSFCPCLPTSGCRMSRGCMRQPQPASLIAVPSAAACARRQGWPRAVLRRRACALVPSARRRAKRACAAVPPGTPRWSPRPGGSTPSRCASLHCSLASPFGRG